MKHMPASSCNMQPLQSHYVPWTHWITRKSLEGILFWWCLSEIQVNRWSPPKLASAIWYIHKQYSLSPPKIPVFCPQDLWEGSGQWEWRKWRGSFNGGRSICSPFDATSTDTPLQGGLVPALWSCSCRCSWWACGGARGGEILMYRLSTVGY